MLAWPNLKVDWTQSEHFQRIPHFTSENQINCNSSAKLVTSFSPSQ